MAAGAEARLEVRFWGVRGSIPTPRKANLGVGGNTACIEIALADGTSVVVDAGTGIREFGMHQTSRMAHPHPLHLFLTHFHWDHIQGLPFYEPLYAQESDLVFHSAAPPNEARTILERQMRHPYFPYDFRSLCNSREYVQTNAEPFEVGPLQVEAFPLNHPNGAVGYRFEYNGAVVVHAADCEHGDPQLDTILREKAREADLLIFDAQYTPEEYEHKRGWGHSTWQVGTEIARDAGVKRLVLFHHDPSRDDASVERITAQARRLFECTYAAREGWVARV